MFNLNHNNVTQEKFVQIAQKYINDMQEALNNKQYELSLNANFLFGEDSEIANLFNEKSEGYFSELLANAQEYGQSLIQNIENGFVNGWDDGVAEKAIIENMQKLNKIQEKIQAAQSKAKMKIATEDFLMSDLSQESFEIYIDKINEETENINKAADTAAANLTAVNQLLLDAGEISQQEFDNDFENNINAARISKKAEIYNAGISEGLKAIQTTFADDFKIIAEQINHDLEGLFIINPDDMRQNMDQLQAVLAHAINKADVKPGTKEAVKGYMEKLLPTTNDFKKLASENQELWKDYSDTLITVEAMNTFIGKGQSFGNAIFSGINKSGDLYGEETGRKLKEKILKPFDEGLKITVPIEISYKAQRGLPTGETLIPLDESKVDNNKKISNQRTINSFGDILNYRNKFFDVRSFFGIPENAMGTSYFRGGLTKIHEKGGEIVDLPTGSRIYPSDKSEKMVKNTPNITVNVNIGSLYDSRDAAEEIGEIICGKIVDAIRSI